MLLNYILHFTQNKQFKDNLLLFQNIYVLFIVFQSLFAIYNYRINNNAILLLNIPIYFKYFVLSDLLLCSSYDMILHHIACLFVTYVSINNPIFLINKQLIFASFILYSCELSTLFLCIKSILLNQFNKNNIIIDILFLLTFTYTRIYLFSKYLIFNKDLYDIFQDQLQTPFTILSNNTIISISLYSLYFLNLYWFIIIIKKIIKKNNLLLSPLYCEKLLKYTYLLSFFGSLYLYSPYTNIIFKIDLIGQSLLCITSYLYHNSIEYKLKNGISEDKIDVLDNKICWYWLNDITCIHIRCFCCIIVHTNLFITNVLDYNYNLKIFMTYISFLLHISSLYEYIKFIINLKNENETFYLTEKNSYKNNVINYLSGSVILLDSLICLTNTNFYVRTNLIIITFLIFSVSYINPFYTMSHLVLHILLFIQTICLCQSNIVSNLHP